MNALNYLASSLGNSFSVADWRINQRSPGAAVNKTITIYRQLLME